MGRAKLAMKYIENSRARRATYKTRMTGVKKKASELFVLCGVDVLVASSSQENNAVQSWPEYDSEEFRRIKERYIKYRRSEMGTAFPSPSPSLPLDSQERLAMSSKLTEIRERLSFLGGEASSTATMASSQFQQDQKALQVQDNIPPSPSLADISMEDIQFFLSDLPLSAMDGFSPSDSPMGSTMDDFNWCDSLIDYEKW